jgi:hypothetical protein
LLEEFVPVLQTSEVEQQSVVLDPSDDWHRKVPHVGGKTLQSAADTALPTQNGGEREGDARQGFDGQRSASDLAHTIGDVDTDPSLKSIP